MSFTYRGLQATAKRHIVTFEEVDRQLHRLQQQAPRITPVTDRPAQQGDEVVLDYAGYCDGVQFPGGTAEKQTLILGSGMFIPGFEEQLVGVEAGISATVDVTFPEVYHSEKLAGKAAQFRCYIHEVRTKEPNTLNEDFAKQLGYPCLEDLRRDVRQQMLVHATERAEMDLQDRLLRQAAATLEFSISEEELSAVVEQQLQNLQAQLAQQGLNLELYCNFMNTTPEQLRADARLAAEAALRNHAAIDKIVELENLQPEPEEIEAALDMVCRQNGITRQQLEAHRDEAFNQAIIKNVLTTKVMSLIRANGQITVE